MISLLRANQDVFAWKHKDMPGIDRKIIQHRLNVNLKYKPVQQKWRIFALERNKAVTEKVEKLLEAVRDRAPGPFYDVLGQTHVNGWSRVIASQNGGSTDYVFPLRLGVLQWSRHLFNYWKNKKTIIEKFLILLI